MDITFSSAAWSEYVYWQDQDRKTLRRINALIKDITRNPFTGRGKPEPLKENKSGLWSRRIDEKNRIVYRVENEELVIFSCQEHYTDR